MFEIIYKIWFFIVILPLTIAIEGWKMLKKYLSKDDRLNNLPYFLLIFFVLLLIVLLMIGYR